MPHPLALGRRKPPDTGGQMAGTKVLIVEDDADFQALIQSWLEEEGYEVHTAANGWEGLQLFAEVRPHLTITDVRMPAMDGFQLISRIREISDAHVLAFTAFGDTENTVRGLELGADDFVVKPFNKEVLKTRVKKRLSGVSRDSVGEITEMGEFAIHWERHEAIHGEEHIPLTTKEIGLLKLFVENEGKLLSRSAILERVWADTYITDRTIDSHVKELRKKLPPLTKFLKTIYGSGYRLDL